MTQLLAVSSSPLSAHTNTLNSLAFPLSLHCPMPAQAAGAAKPQPRDKNRREMAAVVALSVLVIAGGAAMAVYRSSQ